MSRAESGRSELPEVYPKLVVCREFFSYIRGEFFHSTRPVDAQCQSEMYRFEHELDKRLRDLRSKLNTEDSKTSHFLKISKALFD